MANLHTSTLLKLTQFTIKSERYFLYKIPGETPSKRTTLLRVVATNVYVEKI